MNSIEKLDKDLKEIIEEEKCKRADMEAMAVIIRKIGGIYNNHTDRVEPVGGLVLLRNGEIAAWFGGVSSLNRAYYSDKDGRVHVSTWSVGGTVMRGAVTPNNEDIDLYNGSVIDDCVIIDAVAI